MMDTSTSIKALKEGLEKKAFSSVELAQYYLERIAKLAKEDRDKNFVTKNRDGVTVNRWLTTGFFAGSSCSNEAGYLTYKAIRSTGILSLEDQARI